MARTSLCALMSLLAAGLIRGQQQPPEAACDGTTYDMSVCLGKIYQQVDGELNKAYQASIKNATHYGAEDLQNLKDAEVKWIAYRDAHCNAAYHLWGRGSGGPNAHTVCLIQLTRQRTATLKDTYRQF